MIRNHEQWESILLRPWLTEQLWRTYVPHQALITSSSIGKASREIGMPRNTRENTRISGNVFDCQQARRDLEELHNDSRNLTTPSGVADMSRILRKEGIENGGSEEPLQSILLPCFSVRARRKSLDDKISLMSMTNMLWVFGLVLKWHDNSELSHLGDASAKFPDQTEFQSWIVNFQVEVCAKAKNLALILQWIKRSKQPARWRTSSIRNQLRGNISLIMKNWIWWWRRNWNDATILPLWSTKLPSVAPWQGRLKNVFSGKQLGLAQEETLVVFLHTWHATQNCEDNVEWSGDTQEYSHFEQAFSSVPKVKKQTDEKAWTVQRQVLRLKQ